MSAFDPLQTLASRVTFAAVNRILAAAGLTAVLIMTGVMLITAQIYFAEYPTWIWATTWMAAVGLGLNAAVRPRSALSIPAIIVASIVGLALVWPMTIGGDNWWPAWLALGVAMPILGCWLLSAFSLAFRKS
jgi:hypothetical protein